MTKDWRTGLFFRISDSSFELRILVSLKAQIFLVLEGPGIQSP
jgi:hypothetical protein